MFSEKECFEEDSEVGALVSSSKKVESEFVDKAIKGFQEKVINVLEAVKLMCNGLESEAGLKTLFNVQWDKLYPSLPTVWSETNVIAAIQKKQLQILNNGRVKYAKVIEHTNNKLTPVYWAYFCRKCLKGLNKEGCIPSTCFLLHRSKGVLDHMRANHHDIPENQLVKGSSTCHFLIPYQLPIRTICETNPDWLKAKFRVKKWMTLVKQQSNEVMYLEDDDTVVLGTRTVYSEELFQNDSHIFHKTKLYVVGPIFDDQKEKLENNKTVDVYDQLIAMDKVAPNGPFIDFVWNLPKFVGCESDNEIDDRVQGVRDRREIAAEVHDSEQEKCIRAYESKQRKRKRACKPSDTIEEKEEEE